MDANIRSSKAAIFCYIEPIKDPFICISSPHNARFFCAQTRSTKSNRSRREGTPEIHHRNPRFGLPLDPTVPKNASLGYSFGSDPSLCDIILDGPDKSLGVSSIQFRISPDFSNDDRSVLVENASENGIDVSGLELKKLGEKARLAPGRQASIKFGFVYLDVHVPKIAAHDFEEGWRIFKTWAHETPPDLAKMTFGHLTKRTPQVRVEGSKKLLCPDIQWNSGEDYDFFDEVGSRTARRVVRIQRCKDGTTFVAKVVRNHGMPPAESNELEALKSLRHPHILQLIDWGWTQNHDSLYMVSETAQHGTLDSFQQQSGIQLDEGVVRQVLEGVHYMHEQGWVHNDIKPRNIFVCREKPLLVKLGDLGNATKEGYDPQTPFTEPELLPDRPCHKRKRMKRLPSNGPRDVFAIGILLYLIAAGKSLSTPQTAITHLSGIGEAAQQLILSMLAKNPIDRPTAAECLASLSLLQLECPVRASNDARLSATCENSRLPKTRKLRQQRAAKDSWYSSELGARSHPPVRTATPRKIDARQGEDRTSNTSSIEMIQQQEDIFSISEDGPAMSGLRLHKKQEVTDQTLDLTQEEGDVDATSPTVVQRAGLEPAPAVVSNTQGKGECTSGQDWISPSQRQVEKPRWQRLLDSRPTADFAKHSDDVQPKLNIRLKGEVDCLRAVVYGANFTVRLSDGKIDALGILDMAKLEPSKRAYLRKYLSNDLESEATSSPARRWVRFGDARSLAEYLRFDGVLRSIFNDARTYASVRDLEPSEAMSALVQFEIVRCWDWEIPYRKKDRWINVTKILGTADAIVRQVRKSYNITLSARVGNGPLMFRGTYVPPAKAIEICDRLCFGDLAKFLTQFCAEEVTGHDRQPEADPKEGQTDDRTREPTVVIETRALSAVEYNWSPFDNNILVQKSDADVQRATPSPGYQVPVAAPIDAVQCHNADIRPGCIESGASASKMSRRNAEASTRTQSTLSGSVITEPSYSAGSFLPAMGPLEPSFD